MLDPRRLGCFLLFGAVIGCSAAPEPDFHGEEQVATASSAITVSEAVSTGCSTTAVWGLSMQVIEQMNCLIPGDAMKEVPERPNFEKGSATLAFMQPPAVDAFVAALDEMPGTTLTSNSMLRTVVQQYLLYRWYQLGDCGISLAATPGTSNHESGLAVDVSENSTWRPTLEAHGFSWLGSSDPVHFDFEGAGIVDLSGQDVLAFQQLWNLNNPNDPITEDGDYGDETASKLEISPAEGFAIPPSCGSSSTGGSGGSAGSVATGGVAGSVPLGGAGGVAGETGSAGAPPTAAPASGDDSGCGCRTTPSGHAPSALWLLGVLVVASRRARQLLG
jgi:MYXO-CTERM domain-containing protein